MRVDRFEKAKQALLKEMLANRAHCADSVYALRACTGLEELISTLNRFVGELRYKRFPNIEIVREYFSEEIEQLNALGVFIDQDVRVSNIENVWLFGHCTGSVSTSAIKYHNIIINDDAEVTINALPWTLQHVYIKDSSSIVKFNKAHNATQIVVKNKIL